MVPSRHLYALMHKIMETEKRIVMTLDAGGTNLVFSAIQDGKEIVSPITYPSEVDDIQI